jgi:hypothetical protein
MRWRQPKANRQQPLEGSYSDWKEQIANDCWEQCVYCAIHESRYGGLDNFHVEHYKPKSLPQFENLINAIANLFFACAICNRFKGNDWPGDPVEDHSISAYPDPASCDYNSLFVWQTNFLLRGRYQASRYILERLYLNRPQLILERRMFALAQKLSDFQEFAAQASVVLEERADDKQAVNLLGALVRSLASLGKTSYDVQSVRPYNLSDIRRRRRRR